jgi:hypothetical protein
MPKVKLNADGFAFVFIQFESSISSVMQPYSYKVDSGANLTTITRGVIFELGYNSDWIKSHSQPQPKGEQLSVASGQLIEGCCTVTLPEINIHGHVGYNWPFILMPDKSRLLLGTDIMKCFNWSFNYDTSVCEFVLRKSVQEYKPKYSGEQSIHSLDTNAHGLSLSSYFAD